MLLVKHFELLDNEECYADSVALCLVVKIAGRLVAFDCLKVVELWENRMKTHLWARADLPYISSS